MTSSSASTVSMDYFEAPLNPCSVESIQEPVEVGDGSSVWPVMLGCYELQEKSGKRHGRLDLYSVKVPDMKEDIKSSMNLRFGSPLPALTQEETCLSGILDGKFIQTATPGSFYYASAQSSGHVVIHSCATRGTEEDTSSDNQSPLKIQFVGKSEDPPTVKPDGPPPLCLALHWDSTTLSDSSRIVSSYSNGRVAVHDVVSCRTQNSNHHIQLVEHVSWEAHTLFTVPAEVWCTGFVEQNTVLSGGDDATLKVWDIRSTNRPTQVLKDHFEAGVTVIAPHPRQPHLVACGSYDETMNLYDMRYLSSTRKPLAKSGPLGGGIWRLKWHPYDDNRVLVAAMHGGCRIVKLDQLQQGDKPVIVATKEFTEHKSMAYGADWLVCKHPTEDGYFEAAASCSFYDKAVYLWDTVA